MERKKRRLLFFILAMIFAVVAPCIILYSQGYIFDLEKGKIIKTGGIFLKINPKDAEVFLNNKLIKKTGIFTGEIQIMNLTPRTYKVLVKKEGYFEWSKDLKVIAKEVTSAKNITLVPKEHQFSPLEIQGEAKDFLISPDGKKLIVYAQTGNFWNISLVNLENSSSTRIFPVAAEEKYYAFSKFDYSRSGDKFYIAASDWGVNYYFIYDANNFKRLAQTSNSLKAQSLIHGKDLNNVSTTIKTALAYQISDSGLLWLSREGYLNKSDFGSGKNIKIYNTLPLEIKPGAKYEIIENNASEIFVRENSLLYYLDPGFSVFERISNEADSVVFGPYSKTFEVKKTVIKNGRAISIFFMTEEYEQPAQKAKESALVGEFEGGIGNVFWLNGHYLLFNAGNAIKISEIDNRSKTNVIDIGNFPSPKLLYDFRNRKVYILSQGKIYVSNQILE